LLSQHGAIDRLRGEILLWLPPALIIIFLTRIFRNNRRAADRSRYMSEIEKFVLRQSNVEPTVRGYETILTEQREGRSAWSVAVCPGAPWRPGLAIWTWLAAFLVTAVLALVNLRWQLL
jgi:hypothetical protein